MVNTFPATPDASLELFDERETALFVGETLATTLVSKFFSTDDLEVVVALAEITSLLALDDVDLAEVGAAELLLLESPKI